MNDVYDEEMILANTSSISGGNKKNKSKRNMIKSLFKKSKKNKLKKGKSKKHRK